MQTALVGLTADYWERDWIDELFAPLVLAYVSPDELKIGQPALVLFSDSDGRYVKQVEAILNRTGVQGNRRIGVVHLGDEYCRCPIDWYSKAAFVVRNYLRYDLPGVQVLHAPLGYKREFKNALSPKPIEGRQTTWFFAGEVKGSRHEMLAVAQSVPNGKAVTTTKWEDPNGLATRDYAAALCDTVFALCPRGNDSVDCFRVYEALEAGAIPIVEDDGRYDAAMSVLHVPLAVRRWKATHRIRYRYRERFGQSYWLNLYDPTCPLPRITRWKDLPDTLNEVDAVEKSHAIQAWWSSLKLQTRSRISALVELLKT